MPLRNARPTTEFNTRGPFDNSQDYDTDDRVSHNGMSYVAPEPIPAGEGAPNPGTNRWIDDPGSEGDSGNKGIKGDSVRAVYIRTAMQPVAPTGTWNGRTLTLQGGWSETIPSGTETLYRSDATLNNVANTATFTTPQRWTGPVGPEPTDTRLNTLITTLLTAMDLTTADEVNALIQQYLVDNAYRTDASIRDIINEAYRNVLRDLGAIQVQYALNPTSDTDWHDSLTFYDRHRIRLNNPDAEWNIIMGGSVSTGGLSLTFQYTSDTTDATLYHDSPQVDTDTNYRFKVGTGDYGDWQQIGGGGGGSRNLKGDLLATVTIPSGTFADATPFAWSVESGVTLVSSENVTRWDL